MASLSMEPPADVNLNDNKLPELVAVSVTTWVLGFATVILRIVARKKAGNNLWWDDWLVIVAQLWTVAYLLNMTAYLGSQGFGRHIWVAPEGVMKSFLLGIFIGEYAYSGGMAMIKWSILAFYWRVFGADARIRVVIWIMFAIVTAWLIAVLLVATFQCMPPSAFWRRFDIDDPMINYSCTVDVKEHFVANAITNSITDLMILIVPLPSIWALQLQRAQKLALFGIFAVGLFVTAVSAVRLALTLGTDVKNIADVTWYYVEGVLWTEVELNVATICACLPSLKPIFNIMLYGSAIKLPSDSGTANVVGSREHTKWDSKMASASEDSSPTYPRSKNRLNEDTQPLSCELSGELDNWSSRSRDIEMEPVSL